MDPVPMLDKGQAVPYGGMLACPGSALGPRQARTNPAQQNH